MSEPQPGHAPSERSPTTRRSSQDDGRDPEAIHFITKTGRRLRHQYGPYRVRRVIGEGGMGAIVLEAWDTENDTEVALKVFSPDRRMTHEMRRRFIRGARAASGIEHPNVVQIYDTGEEAGRPYFAMELVHGCTLDELLREEDRLTPHRAIEICLQAARGLRAAAQHGVIHRDIKPQNVLIPDDGQAKIADFGIASIEQQESIFLHPGIIVGTPTYMPPEMCQAEAVDHRSDIYSLGITLYEMLSGKPPFHGSPVDVMYKQSHKRPKPITRRVPTLHPRLARVVMKMIAKKPSSRYQDYDPLIRDLEDIQKRSQFVIRSRRRPGTISALGVGIAVGLFGALWYSGWWVPPAGQEEHQTQPPSTRVVAPEPVFESLPLPAGTFGPDSLTGAGDDQEADWSVRAYGEEFIDDPGMLATAKVFELDPDQQDYCLQMTVTAGQTLNPSEMAVATPWCIATTVPAGAALSGHTLRVTFRARGEGASPMLVLSVAEAAGDLNLASERFPIEDSWREYALSLELPPEGSAAEEQPEDGRQLRLRFFLAGQGDDTVWLDDVRLHASVPPAEPESTPPPEDPSTEPGVSEPGLPEAGPPEDE